MIKYDELNSLLDEAEKRYGISKLEPLDNKLQEYSVLTQDKIRGYRAHECGEIAILLMSYSLFLQNEINKYHAMISWANKTIDFMTSPRLSNYGTQYTKEDTKRLLAINDDTSLTRLYDQKIKWESSLSQISYLPSRLENLAKAYSELQQTKRRENNG